MNAATTKLFNQWVSDPKDDGGYDLNLNKEETEEFFASISAKLYTAQEDRQVMAELYNMAIEHCKYRGWSKHPTIDKAHALLFPERNRATKEGT